MIILKKQENHECVNYRLFFECKEFPEVGFAFECDKSGNLLKISTAVWEMYLKCLSGKMEIIENGVRKTLDLKEGKLETYHHFWVSPAIGKCECGAEIELDEFTTFCSSCYKNLDI